MINSTDSPITFSGSGLTGATIGISQDATDHAGQAALFKGLADSRLRLRVVGRDKVVDVSDELEALSKAGGEILNDPSVREFIGRITGEPAAELGGLLGDRIRWWRFRQWVKLCGRAKELLDDAGLEAHEVRPGVLVPVLEGGSLADDDSPFQERWAALLANAAATPSAIPPSFAHILGQLDPTDAKLLDAIFAWANVPGRNWQQDEIDGRAAASELGIEGRDFELALDNLIRLRMVNTQATWGALAGETVLLTTLGSEFVRACKPPGTHTEPSPRATVRPSRPRT